MGSFPVRSVVEWVAKHGAGHAATAAAAPAELAGVDGDDLDAGLAQLGVRERVAVVADDDAGLQGDDVVAVVPLLALRAELVAAGRHHAELDPEGPADEVQEGFVLPPDVEPGRGAAVRPEGE